MKKKYVLFLFLTFQFNAFSQTSEDWFQLGEEAYDAENYQKAQECYKEAANLGSSKACGALAYMYYYGGIKIIENGQTKSRNPELAELWAKRAGEHNNIEADAVMALIQYYKGNFSETIRILNNWDIKKGLSEAKLALAICYMINKKENNKAEKLIKSVYDETRYEKDAPDYFYVASALLAKIEYDKWEKDGNIKTHQNCEIYISPLIEPIQELFCPLATYIMAKELYEVGNENEKELCKNLIEIASKYNYYKNRFELLYPFSEEINQYYNMIK